MSSNSFNGKRFLLLCKQHFIHHHQLLLLATVAYIGVIIIVLSIAQISNELQPHNLDVFHGFLLAFVAVFGLVYVGHSFPAFRSKESTINYLMIPGSILEKFTLEFIIRVVFMLLALPLFYWITFHIQGYFFAVLTSQTFEPIGIKYLVTINAEDENFPVLISILIATSTLLAFVLSFTGATMFSKQPLVKSLFAVAVVIAFYVGYSYLVLEHFNVGRYDPPAEMWLVPTNEESALSFVTLALLLASAVLLFVAYRKVKEREV